jgi:DNA-binding NarL/FixJ family response regulator
MVPSGCLELSEPAPVSVVVASDHPALGLALRALFEREPRISVVGDARSGAEAIDQIRRLRPAVLLLEMRSPGADSFAALAYVGRGTAVLVVSALTDPDVVWRTVMAGARSYLVHGFFGQQQLIDAVLDTAEGLSHLSPPAASALVDRCFERPSGEAPPADGALTRREREVLALMAEGLSNRQIADRLTISGKTVKNHVHHVYKRLQVDSRDQAVALWWVLRHQRVDAPDIRFPEVRP